VGASVCTGKPKVKALDWLMRRVDKSDEQEGASSRLSIRAAYCRQTGDPTVNKESFLEVVRQQYSEEIHAAYVEHSHATGKIDIDALNKRLHKLMANAKVEGLAAPEFEELARATLPAEVALIVDFKTGKKAA
jgi:hypothetical protein